MPSPRSNAMLGAVRAGDIMIKYSDGSILSKLIRFGQFFGRGSSKFVHAGIASSGVTIIEMDGNGLTENNLIIDNSQYKYDVFRCNYPTVASGATETAKMMLEGVREFQKSGPEARSGMRIQYTVLGAARSISKKAKWDGRDVINTTLDNLLQVDGGSAFFCSGHVVLCYQSSMGQHQIQQTLPVEDAQKLFSLKDTCYQPSFLHKSLSNSSHFRKIGTVKGNQLVPGV